MGVPDHRAAADSIQAVPYTVLTVSDSRSEADDTSGRLIRQLFDEAGHSLTDYELVRNVPRHIQAAVRLGLSKLLLPELPHLIWVASR